MQSELGNALKGNFKWLVYALGAIIAGVLLWKAFPSNAADTTVQWKFGDQSLNLNVKKDMSDPEVLIRKLMSQQFSRAGTLALLNQNNIYSITDPAIIPALSELCPNRGPAGETPVIRQERLQTCLNSAVLKELRDLASQHEAPFQYIGRVVEIGTPADSQPKAGQANVCENGGFLGHQVEIDTLAGQRKITVEATGYYACTGYSVVPDIQLSGQDAVQLFGRPTRKLEKAVAVTL